MTHLRILIPLTLVGSGALAAESVGPPQGLVPERGSPLQLLTPRDASRYGMPPLSDAYRCEPVIHIEEGTPVAFLPDPAGPGTESRETLRLCEG